MMRKLVLPMALLATLAGTLIATPSFAKDLPDPLGLRGFNLGMTLGEIRRQKYPDPTKDEVRLICWSDGLPRDGGFDLKPSDIPLKIGVNQCGFAAVAKGKARAVPLNVGGHDADVLFFITPRSTDPAVSERLFEIVVSIKNVPFDDLAKVYVARFGPPDARPHDLAMRWENSRVELSITELDSDSVYVDYADKELQRKIKALVDKITIPGMDKL